MPEPYHALGTTLSQRYGIHLDEHSLPRITSLPDDYRFPESPKPWFREEVIKVRDSSSRKLSMTNPGQLYAFHYGTITEEVATTFLPSDFRGDLNHPRRREFIEKLIESKGSLEQTSSEKQCFHSSSSGVTVKSLSKALFQPPSKERSSGLRELTRIRLHCGGGWDHWLTF
jgi:hypothetical protein